MFGLKRQTLTIYTSLMLIIAAQKQCVYLVPRDIVDCHSVLSDERDRIAVHFRDVAVLSKLL